MPRSNRRHPLLRKARKRIRRALAPRRVGWMLLAAGAGMLAEGAVLGMLERGWRAARGEEPPFDPLDDETPLGAAIAWSAAAGLAIGTARLLAQRGAAHGWRRASGRRPPR